MEHSDNRNERAALAYRVRVVRVPTKRFGTHRIPAFTALSKLSELSKRKSDEDIKTWVDFFISGRTCRRKSQVWLWLHRENRNWRRTRFNRVQSQTNRRNKA